LRGQPVDDARLRVVAQERASFADVRNGATLVAGPLRAMLDARFPTGQFLQDSQHLVDIYLFAAAQVSGARLQAVTLRYGEAGRLDPIAPFTGDAKALPHLWRVLHHPGIRVQVQFLPSFASQGLERKAMATACRQTIAAALGLEHSLPHHPGT